MEFPVKWCTNNVIDCRYS